MATSWTKGACFNVDPDAETIEGTYVFVACSAPHEAEVTAVFDYEEWDMGTCDDAFEDFVGIPPMGSDYSVGMHWRTDTNLVACAVTSLSGQALTGSAKGAGE